MTFTDFCDNSRKLNRSIIVVSVIIITGLLYCVPLFRTLNPDQLSLLDTTRNVWTPIFAGIIGYFFKEDKIDSK